MSVDLTDRPLPRAARRKKWRSQNPTDRPLFVAEIEAGSPRPRPPVEADRPRNPTDRPIFDRKSPVGTTRPTDPPVAHPGTLKPRSTSNSRTCKPSPGVEWSSGSKGTCAISMPSSPHCCCPHRCCRRRPASRRRACRQTPPPLPQHARQSERASLISDAQSRAGTSSSARVGGQQSFFTSFLRFYILRGLVKCKIKTKFYVTNPGHAR